MRCTNRRLRDKKRRNKRLRKRRLRRIITGIAFLIFFGGILYSFYSCNSRTDALIVEYEAEHYNRSLYNGNLFAKNLCTVSSDISLEGYTDNTQLHAAGLFDVNEAKTLYAFRVHDQIYPASTTKILTAYVALKHGNLDDIVTVGENAVQFDWDAQLCGLQAGDTLTLYDLLCGLLLYSGNDTATAIAEYISGSQEAFCQLMNEEARLLGATHTNFVNPHGLHDVNHYTTAYDLYLIFNACIKDQRFLDIISMESYTASITDVQGQVRYEEWLPTNYYSAGLVDMPEGVQVIGGKTGNTDEAGSCLILYNKNAEDDSFISVVMGAEDRESLYPDMSEILFWGCTK